MTSKMITDFPIVPGSNVEAFRFDRKNGILCLMDCGGSNVKKINEQIPGIVRIIATARIDHPEVGARERAQEIGVPLVEMDLESYEKQRGIKRGDYYKAINSKKPDEKGLAAIQARREFFKDFYGQILDEMTKNGIIQEIPCFAAGFMQLIPEEYIDWWLTGNVHPGDLLVREKREDRRLGKRLLYGDAWVPSAKAMRLGCSNLRSSFHLMTAKVDAGPIFMRGYELPMDYKYLAKHVNFEDKEQLKAAAGHAQECQKQIGDHVIAGATFDDLLDGLWGKWKGSDWLCYKVKGNWHLAPDGIVIEDHLLNKPDSVFKRSSEFLEEKINEFYEKIGGMNGIR
ncbi:MAG: hypothetical protein ABIF10_05810 [Candidatus Woesearchaeota archaeon]